MNSITIKQLKEAEARYRRASDRIGQTRVARDRLVCAAAETMTTREIAAAMGLSHQRVAQIIAAGIGSGS